ncbi:MAG: LEPR-XLL domain-containing protein, partial [Gammaproteobacteria bacterium]|nr:LEPR-XLL domain-containing protein [Gammaproteobacteria bacterium]
MAPGRKLLFESLEPRLLLSADPFTYTAAAASDLTLRLTDDAGAQTLTLVDTSGAVLAERSLADTSTVTVVGSPGDDTLTVDFATPFSLPVTFHGEGGYDELFIAGGEFSAVAYRAAGPDSGTIDFDETRISYTGIEPITDSTVALDVSFTATAGDDVIRITDADVGWITVASDNATFESVTFANTALTLTVDAGGGDDVIIVDDLDPSITLGATATGDTELHLVFGAGADTFVMSRDADFSIGDLGVLFGAEQLFFDDAPERAVIAGNSLSTFGFSGSAILASGLPEWSNQGPGPISGGQVTGIAAQPVTGAIQAVAPHPTDANTIYIGTVGGGVWKTTDGGASWQALTDQLPSLSISSLAIDPADASGNTLYAGTGQASSSLMGGEPIGLLKTTDGGATWTVIRKSFFQDRTVHAIAPTPSGVLLVATQATQFGAMATQLGGGLLRSTNGGQTFFKISGNADDTLNNDGDGMVDEPDEDTGLPGGTVTDLVVDPGNPDRIYAAMPGQGVFVSNDGGLSWSAANTGLTGIAQSTRIRLAASAAVDGITANNPVYAALISNVSDVTTAASGAMSVQVAAGTLLQGGDTVTISGGGNSEDRLITSIGAPAGGFQQVNLGAALNNAYAAGATLDVGGERLAGVFRSDDLGGSWTSMDVPGTNESTGFVGIHPGAQADTHFSMVADPADADVVYVGGDRQPGGGGGEPAFPNASGADNFTARLFRGDASLASGSQWQAITDDGAPNDGAGGLPGTAPHADSRDMAFVGGNLVEVDDGGIYQLSNPGAVNRTWTSLNGNLTLTEFYSVAWDSVNDVILGGTQDVGVALQSATGSSVYLTLTQGDGAIVQTDGATLFYSNNSFGSFTTQTGAGTTNPTLNVNGTGGSPDDIYAIDNTIQFVQPFVLNGVDPTRLLIGTNFVYESTDTGATLTLLNGAPVATGGGNFALPPAADLGVVSAMVYGGRQPDGMGGFTDMADVVLVGSDGSSATAANAHFLWVRQTAGAGGALQAVASYTNQVGFAVRDVAVDPDDWRNVYVLDALGDVWFTGDGAANPASWSWSRITGNLSALPGTDNLHSLAVENTGATTVVLVGGEGGVFRRVGAGQWTEYGSGIPNTLVTDIDRIGGADDLLLLGTLGRGAWTVGDASATIGETAALTLSGGPGDNVFYLERNAASPWLLDVFQYLDTETKPATPSLSVPFASLESIVINGEDGDDTFVIDASNGAIAVPGGITVDGGAGNDDIQLLQASMSTVTGNTGIRPGGDAASGSHGLTIRDAFGESASQSVTWSGVETATDAVVVVQDVNALGAGLAQLSNAFQDALGDSLRDQEIAGLDAGSLASALSGQRAERVRPKDTPFVAASQVGDSLVQLDDASSIIKRLFEEGLGAFNLSDIATDGAIDDPEALRQALDDLDAIDGNVILTQVGDDLTYDVEVIGKALDGIVDIDVNADIFGGGEVALTGELEVTALIDLDFTFGVDAGGFFITPNGPADPELTIRQISVSGDVAGSGRLGFLGVDVDDATLTLDPDVSIELSLTDPGTDAADGTIRAVELSPPDFSSLVDVNLEDDVADGNDDDVILTGNFGVAALLPGFESGIDLVDAELSIIWPDFDEVSQVQVTASAAAGEALLDFLEVTSQEVLDQLEELRDQLSIIDLDIPFLQQGLDELANLIDAFQENVIDPLTDPLSGSVKVPTLQELAVELAASLGIDLGTLGLAYDSATKELTYHLELTESVSASDSISLSQDLEEGLADLEFSTDASITGDIVLALDFGIDIGAIEDGDAPEQWFFIRDAGATGTLTVEASDVDAAARFGFLSIEIVDGSAFADPSVTISLTDPGTNAADGRIDLGELIDNFGDPGSLVSADLTGSASFELPVSAPFIGLAPGPDTTITISFSEIDDPESFSVSIPPGLGDLTNFTNINAASLVGLLGQLTGWLDEFRRSDTFADFDVPFVGPALDQILGFADAFRDTLLFDDGDDGEDEGDKLITDINDALAAADLGTLIRAEADGDSVRLIALDPTVNEFSITAPGGNELGFGTSQDADTSGTTPTLTAISPAPEDGQLTGDITFNVSINGGASTAVTVLAADTEDNDGLGNDITKLVDPNGSPTFSTAQEFAARVAEILGVPDDLVAYDDVEDILTLKLDLSETFGELELPVEFNLDLAPLLSLESDSRILLTASGDLSMTLGVFLGDAPSSTLIDGTTLLADINGGVDIKTDLAVTAVNDVSSFTGRLSGDAKFKLAVDGGPQVDVNVTRVSTQSNTTLDDLVTDVNTALARAGLAAQIQAQRGTDADENKLLLVGLGGVTSFSVSSASGTPAFNELGFTPKDAEDVDGTLTITGARDITPRIGQLASDAVFSFQMNTANGGAAVPVVLQASETFANRNILELVNDLQKAIDGVAALEDKIAVSSVGRKLVFTAIEPGTTSFSIAATAGNPAVTTLGLATANVGNSVEFYLVTQDGARSGITLDGATTLQDVFDAIGTQSGGKVTAAINDNGTGINLTDNTAGGTVFKVETTNGSMAALELGIQLVDQPPADDPEGDPDGIIEGAPIGGISLMDRFFVADTGVSVDLSLSTPEPDTDDDGMPNDVDGDGELDDGLRASASFGFVTVALSGGGTIDGTLSLELQDPGTVEADGRISLTELLDGLADIDTLIDAPDLTGGGTLVLDIDVEPDIPGVNVPDEAQIVINILDLGNPFTGEAPDIDFTFPDVGDLIAFDNVEFNFDTILDALLELSDFLGQFEAFDFLNEPIPLINVSVNDLLTFTDQFRDAINEARSDPAASLQLLENKLKAALGQPATSDVVDLSLVTTGGAEILRIDVGWDAGFSESLPLNLDLGLPEFANLTGSAGLSAQGSVDVSLDFGIDLNNPLDIYIFDTTGITGGIALTGDELEFRAALGPLGIFIKDGDASLTADFDVGLENAIFSNNRVLLTSIDFGSAFEANITGNASANLPAFFPTESIDKGAIELGANLVFGTDGIELVGTLPGGEFVSVPDDLFDIDPADFGLLDNILLAIDGIDAFLAGLQDVLDGEIFGAPLPLVGDKLASAAQFIEDFRRNFIDQFREGVENITSPTDNIVSNLLFDLLGPGPDGLGILLDGDDAGSDVNVTDVVLTTDGDNFLQWNMLLGQTLTGLGTGIGFDIGLPGLGLETEGELDIELGWELDFGFGLNRDDGFYLDISDPSELEVFVDVTVPGAAITGRLGILQIEAFDNGDTHLAATFGVNVVNRRDDTDEHLSFAELPSIGLEVGMAAEAIVDLGMELQLNSDLVPGADTNFPKVVADFFLDWGFGDVDTGTLEEISDLGNILGDHLHLVEFRDVGLDLGTYISDVVGPIVAEVQKVTEPLQPIIDVITAPIPVISDLAGQPISLLDLAAVFAGD